MIAIALVLAVVAVGNSRIFFQPIPAQLGHAWADMKRRTGLVANDSRTAGDSLVLSQPAAIAGVASVIDGDTIEIHGHRIRLHGIDAPEGGQINLQPPVC